MAEGVRKSSMQKVRGLIERGKLVRRLEFDLLVAVRDKYTINRVFRKLTRKQQRSPIREEQPVTGMGAGEQSRQGI